MKYILIGLFFLCGLTAKSQVAIGGDGQVHSAATGGTVTNTNELKIGTDTTAFKNGIAVLSGLVYVYHTGKWQLSSGDSTVSNLVNYYTKSVSDGRFQPIGSYATLNTAQTFTAVKSFTAGLNAGTSGQFQVSADGGVVANYIYANNINANNINAYGNIYADGNINATSFIKSSSTASQFLMGNGTTATVGSGLNLTSGVLTASSSYTFDTTSRATGVKTIYKASTDSATLRGLINSNTTGLTTKLNLSDTAAMLTNYAGAINTNSTNIATNTTNITNEITRATAAELLKLNISDSLVKYVTPKNLKDSGTVYRGLIGGKIDSIRLANTGILHTTPAAFSLSGTTAVITQTLATQAASVVLRTGNVTGQPAFGKIDSTHAPDLHSQGYYDGRYGTVAQQNINAANITTNTTNITSNTNAIATKLNISDTASMLSAKQATLVSGTNIKTVNGNTLLGSGDLIIAGGVTSVNTRTGAVVINSGDITSGLGYTPLDTLNGTYLKTVTLSNTGVIHNAPTYAYNATTKNYTITQTLANQTANMVFGTGASSATPSFRNADSLMFGGNWATQVRNASNLDSSKFLGTTRINDTARGNKTFTGLTSILSTTPELRLTTSADNLKARITRNTTNNNLNFYNSVNQVGGVGNALSFNSASSQYVTYNNAALSSTSLSVSFWVKNPSGCAFTLGDGGSGQGGICYSTNGGGISNLSYRNNGGAANVGFTGNLTDGNWHHLSYTISGTTLIVYLDGSQVLSQAITAFNPTSYTANLGRSTFLYVGEYYTGQIDQFIVYNTTLTQTQVGYIYNGGTGTTTLGTGTGSSGMLPLTGLIRRYEFEEGSGSTTADTNPNATQYTATLLNGVTWSGVGNGKVPASPTSTEGNFISYIDGQNTNERGQLLLGDVSGGNVLQGLSVKAYINASLYPLIINTNGKTLISSANASASTTALSSLSVVGNQSIGINAVAPVNGLTVSGNALFGTTTDNTVDKLQVNGSLIANSLKTPLLVGGIATTSSITYKTTTGVGTTGADHIFQVGNNGTTEAMRILNNGSVALTGALNGTSANFSGDISTPFLSFHYGSLNAIYSNATDEFGLNYLGYQNGTTQFRNLTVYDGKNNQVAKFTGSDKSVLFSGALNGTTANFSSSLTANTLKLNVAANSGRGSATLSNGTVTISNTSITTGAMVMITYASGSTLNIGVGNVSTMFYVPTITNGTSFVINALTVTGTVNTTDNSQVMYTIIN